LHFSGEESGGGVAFKDELGYVEEDSKVHRSFDKIAICYGDCRNIIQSWTSQKNAMVTISILDMLYIVVIFIICFALLNNFARILEKKLDVRKINLHSKQGRERMQNLQVLFFFTRNFLVPLCFLLLSIGYNLFLSLN
jgi:hypothetical protein